MTWEAYRIMEFNSQPFDLATPSHRAASRHLKFTVKCGSYSPLGSNRSGKGHRTTARPNGVYARLPLQKISVTVVHGDGQNRAGRATRTRRGVASKKTGLLPSPFLFQVKRHCCLRERLSPRIGGFGRPLPVGLCRSD